MTRTRTQVRLWKLIQKEVAEQKKTQGETKQHESSAPSLKKRKLEATSPERQLISTTSSDTPNSSFRKECSKVSPIESRTKTRALTSLKRSNTSSHPELSEKEENQLYHTIEDQVFARRKL
jgi:hypothetical protein